MPWSRSGRNDCPVRGQVADDNPGRRLKKLASSGIGSRDLGNSGISQKKCYMPSKTLRSTSIPVCDAAPFRAGTCRGRRKAGKQAGSLWEFRRRAPWPAARPVFPGLYCVAKRRLSRTGAGQPRIQALRVYRASPGFDPPEQVPRPREPEGKDLSREPQDGRLGERASAGGAVHADVLRLAGAPGCIIAGLRAGGSEKYGLLPTGRRQWREDCSQYLRREPRRFSRWERRVPTRPRRGSR